MTHAASAIVWSDGLAKPGAWLIARRSDFWLACAGGGALLVGIVLMLLWHGDRELRAADLLLAELHLGATYDAVVRGRLWRRRPFEVMVAPLAITAVTYALMLGEQSVLVTTIVLYLAAWHRGRQNFGIARFYQARMDRPPSLWHGRLFRLAIYMPMAAGTAYFANTAPLYEGDEFLGLGLDPSIVDALGVLALASVGAYLAFTVRGREPGHPGERWLVVANAVAFGSGYVLGAWSMSFICVLTVHHEIQYLYFTYAMARRSAGVRLARDGELRLLASFALWPMLGLASWALCQLSDSASVSAFLVAGLLCHYWLDSRIWGTRSRVRTA